MFVNSGVVAQIVGILSVAGLSTLGVMVRMLVRIARMEQWLKGIDAKIDSVGSDKDIVRWSTLGDNGSILVSKSNSRR